MIGRSEMEHPYAADMMTAAADERKRQQRQPTGGRMQGTVKKLVADKGFGFIKDEQGTEYFFHRSEAQEFDRLREGQKVVFDGTDSPKGMRATGVYIR